MNGKPLPKEKDKPKSERLPKIGKLQKECDTLLQTIGRQKFQFCEVCGKPISCLHHFYPKSISSRLRYDWNNLIPICNGCHMQHHQAGNPDIHGTIIKKRGMAWYEALKEAKKELIKVSRAHYEVIKEMLMREL